MRVIVIRPQPGAAATAERLSAMGLDPLVAPLFVVAPIAWRQVDPDRYDALLIGSANALRHAGPQLAGLARLPVYAVGAKSAAMARGQGLRVVAQGSGGLATLIPALAADGRRRVLRLAGADHVALPDAPMPIETETVYDAEARAMSPTLVAALAEPALILLHSGRAAAHFAAECDRHGIDRRQHRLACFAPAIAAAAGPGWAAAASAPAPNDAALLALAEQMCDSHAQPSSRQSKPISDRS